MSDARGNDNPRPGLNPDRYIDQAEIMQIFRLSRTRLFEMRRSGEFPAPIKTHGRKKLWLRHAVLDWARRQEKAGGS